MKFSCPKCNTRYNIADDKVPASAAVRFTCKKCGNVIRVRKKEDGEKDAEEDRTVVAPPAPIAAPGPAPKKAATGESSTRVVSLAEINALKAASASATAVGGKAEPEWFVLIAGAQRGPLSASEVRAMLEQREIDKRTYVWREGLPEWQRLAQVEELAGLGGESQDAAWRVVKPAEEEPAAASPPVRPATKSNAEATVAMSATRLQEELRKTRAAQEATVVSKAPRPPASPPTQKANLQALLDAARVDEQEETQTRSPMPLDSPTVPYASRKHSAQDDDALFNSFLGEPTQDRLPSPFDRERSDRRLMSNEPSSSFSSSSPTSPQLDQPIGDATRVFMTTAGLYSRRRTHRIAGISAGIGVTLLSSIVMLDLFGIYSVPGMGAVYDVTGLQDPNIERAVERVEEKLTSAEIPAEERAQLEQKLVGLQEKAAKKGIAVKKVALAKPAAEPAAQQGIEEKKTLTQDERSLVANIFADDRKKETGIKLIDPSDIQTPNLPEGLTQDAIFKVISDNTRSMQLCLEESFKKGDKPPSKMEVELTIAPNGSVQEAGVGAAQTSTMGACTVKRVKNWKFPRFNGEPVTVVFPYVLQQGM